MAIVRTGSFILNYLKFSFPILNTSHGMKGLENLVKNAAV